MFLGTRRALSTQYQPGHSLQADQGNTEDVQDQGGRREREGWPRWTGSGTVAEQYSKFVLLSKCARIRFIGINCIGADKQTQLQ